MGQKKFATKEATFTQFQTLYSLAQCTPDISSEDCHACLEEAITGFQKYCSGNTSALALYPSCTMRYQIAPFYQQSNPTAAVPPPAPPAPPLLLPSPPPGLKVRKNKIAQKKHNDRIKAKAMQSLQFELSIIESATNKFAEDNKIGAGGFGIVYKGTLPNGQEIAVKRLSSSTSSGQGCEEFRNEVLVVAKLQHRNLVKLLGYCLE
ncbi:hypothetical protein COLO4_15182 [Corchorus olitorius]|uniref:Gnk2-homologous domain-containing protein n=1 Tax=Corchorus olitorius TaxID=93759 RepID=A0A1R3JP58_9ROSI|nr:hypothetical protein COLO4_15182 [Corchorus olitorius]